MRKFIILFVAFLLMRSFCCIASPPIDQFSQAPPLKLCSLCQKIITFYDFHKINIEYGGSLGCWSVDKLNAQKEICHRVIAGCARCNKLSWCKGKKTRASVQQYLDYLRASQEIKDAFNKVLNSSCSESIATSCNELFEKIKLVNCNAAISGQCLAMYDGALNTHCSNSMLVCSKLHKAFENIDCHPSSGQCDVRLREAFNQHCIAADIGACRDLDWPNLATGSDNCPSPRINF